MITEHAVVDGETYQDISEFDADADRWSSSKSGLWGKCPTAGYYGHTLNLTSEEESPPLYSGKALHVGLETYYVSGDRDLALAQMAESFGERDQLPPGHKYSHLNLGHLEVVFQNYMDWADRRDHFEVIAASLEDLSLEGEGWRVCGARFKVYEETGEILFGESKVVFGVEPDPAWGMQGDDKLFKITVIPDMPIDLGGGFYVLDHKSTNGYLSDWYFSQYKLSNQLRIYCWSVQKLIEAMDIRVNGALINGLYMGDRASLSEFKGTRFARFGPMLFQPAHLTESLINHYYWSKTKEYYDSIKYYPQNAGRSCQGCSYAPLCTAAPKMRKGIISQQYKVEERH